MNAFKGTLLIAGISALLAAPSAKAVYLPGYDRPVETAEMQVVEARYGFENASDVTLTMTHRDGDGTEGMILEYRGVEGVADSTRQSVLVNIIDSYQDDCGSTHFHASLHGEEPFHGQRLSIHLVDHRSRRCEDYRPYIWEASVRSGYGWCGTMDATMELVGNPEPVYTIMGVHAE